MAIMLENSRPSMILCLWIALGFSCNAHPYQSARSNLKLAIGFDLTEYYGTSSVQIAPGNSIPLVRVEGGEEYITMIRRLNQESSRHPAHPYEWFHDPGMGFNDIPRQMLRGFRKSVGLPASHDAGIISEMLTALKEDSEVVILSDEVRRLLPPTFNHNIASIVLSSPEINALYDEDLIDAADYSGLSLLSTEWYARQPKHVNAYWNAYGLEDADDTKSNAQPRAVLLAHLTRQGLELSEKVKFTNRTCTLGWAQRHTWFSHELGAAPDISNEEASTRNWTARLKEFVQSCSRYGHQNPYGYHMNTTDVVFGGESGMNGLLQQSVLDAIKDGQPFAPPVRVWPKIRLDSVQPNRPECMGQKFDHWIKQYPQAFVFGGSSGAASMAWDMLHRKLPTNLTQNECWLEDRGEVAGPSIPYYGSGLSRYLAELWVDAGWLVWRKACCMFVPGCPLPSC